MSTIKDFQIVSYSVGSDYHSEGIKEMKARISYELSKGWELEGELIITTSQFKILYAQKMVKTEPEIRVIMDKGYSTALDKSRPKTYTKSEVIALLALYDTEVRSLDDQLKAFIERELK